MPKRVLRRHEATAFHSIGEGWAVTYVPLRLLQILVDHHLIEVELVGTGFKARLTREGMVERNWIKEAPCE